MALSRASQYILFFNGMAMKAEAYCLIATMLIGLPFAVSAQDTSGIAGTYEILICKSKSEFSNACPEIAHGTLVISDRPFAPEEIVKVGKMDFPPPLEEMRACFSGNRPDHAQTYAFIDKRAAIGWSIENAVLKVELFRSADAGYNAELRIDGDKLSGTGHSWGAGAAAPGFANADALVGHRIGPPDISACLSDIK